MENIWRNVQELLKKPGEYLRPSKKLQDAWVEQTRLLYNLMKEEETRYNLPSSPEALQCLYTDGLDAEQIWQLVELQNRSLLAAPDDLAELDDSNLCFVVAKLSSLAKFDKLQQDNDGQNIEAEGDSEHNVKTDSSDEGGDDLEDEEEEMNDSLDESDNESRNQSGDELFRKPENMDIDDEFGDDSDDEVDNFDELVAREGDEDSDSSEEKEFDETQTKIDSENNNLEHVNRKNEVKRPTKFKKTEIDSKFFNLRESEWVADNDIIGQNFSDDEEIDYMGNLSDDEEQDGVMYEQFFDEDPLERSKNKAKKLSELLKDDVEGDDSEDASDNEDSDADDEIKDASENFKEEESRTTDAKEDDIKPLLGGRKEEVMSTFEKEREKELKLIEALEEGNISEKPWFLRGEAIKDHRPENSALEEHLDYDIAVRQRPVITEDTTTLVEKVIMNRIRTKAWDDVERKVKPTVDPNEYKKKLLLDQEKSKQSLAEIYEQEYVKKQQDAAGAGEEEELKEHKEIREKMDKLFSQLDALANYHYTPRQVSAEVKIQSNLPAINIEEATPDTVSTAMLLAPQEVIAPVRGELIGKTERTSTDKKHERRIKKAHQKKKTKLQDKKLQEKLKKAGSNGKLDSKSSARVVEKAVKTGQIKLLENTQHKAVRSSESFFKQLQDNTAQKTKQKKSEAQKKKKKKGGNVSASKLLL